MEVSAVLQVVEPEPVVKPKPAVQDLPADEAVPGREDSVPVAERVLVSDIPEATPREVESGELPSEHVSPATPVPASEQPASEGDISTVKETLVVTGVDSEPIVVEDTPAAESQPVPADDVAPVIQVSPLDEGQAADSVDVVETTALDDPTPEAVESASEEDAPPEVPDVVEATSAEQATESLQVVNDTALPAPENVDLDAAQAADEVVSSSAERDAEHVVPTTQPAEGSPLSQITSHVQDTVIEQSTVEETSPIPEASASESIVAGGPAVSQEDETSTEPAEFAVPKGMAFGPHLPIFS